MNAPDQTRHTEGPSSQPVKNGLALARDQELDRGGQAVGQAKFDLGVPLVELPMDLIPWGYGEDRITAMAKDPDWLFVYWEITNGAIAAARKRLGPHGPEAWLALRISDTTGRDFDGANAHEVIDIAVDRNARDWFVHLGKPTSSCHAEIGLKTRPGQFTAIARSGRVDFPRKSPSSDSSVDWMTVQDLPRPEPLAAPALPPTVADRAGAMSDEVQGPSSQSFAGKTLVPAEGRISVQQGQEAKALVQLQGHPAVLYGPWQITIQRFSPKPQPAKALAHWQVQWASPLTPLPEAWDTSAEVPWRKRVGLLGPQSLKNFGQYSSGSLAEIPDQFESDRPSSQAQPSGLGGASEIAVGGASEQFQLGGSEKAQLQAWLNQSESSPSNPAFSKALGQPGDKDR